ncbi:MAG: hypothetical protein IJD93_03715 [Ruminococcus sp.]|nr:hypothetical protein [Ruminococcus sp.]
MTNNNLHVCPCCDRPFHSRFLAKIDENEYICPQCAEKVKGIYEKHSEAFDSGKLDDIAVFDNIVSGQEFNGAYTRKAVSAYKKAIATDRDLAARHDEFMHFVSGFTTRMLDGTIEGGPEAVRRYIWGHQQEVKFETYLPAVKKLDKEITYEKLCELLVLPQFPLDEIMAVYEVIKDRG